MAEQLYFSFFKPENYFAIYFNLGMYDENDNVPKELIGFDCPFDDSPVIYGDYEEIKERVLLAYNGEYQDIEEEVYPDVITDSKGNLVSKLYNIIFPEVDFDPDTIMYSFGRETLTQFWEREKYRWFKD